MPSVDPLGNVRVVLCDTSHPGNIGASARALKTMGLGHLHLVRPQRFPDPEAVWRAARAADVLGDAQVHATLDDALAGVAFSIACSARTREIAVPALDCRHAVGRAVEVARMQPVAFVFGNETSGLSNEEAGLCNLWAHVPTNPEYASLNLAAAVQIFAYELRMAAIDGEVRVAPEFMPATNEQVEHLYRHFEQTMIATGFLDPANPKRLLPRLRRLLARARLESDEVNILRGFLNTFGKRPRD